MYKPYPKPFDKPKTPTQRKRRPTSPRKRIERKLDLLVSKICRKQGYCTICGKGTLTKAGNTQVLNAHHFLTRGLKGTRWYLPNLVCLCVHHHTFNHKFSAHKTPEAFKAKMIELNGQEWFDDIQNRATSHIGWKQHQLETMLEEYGKI